MREKPKPCDWVLESQTVFSTGKPVQRSEETHAKILTGASVLPYCGCGWRNTCFSICSAFQDNMRNTIYIRVGAVVFVCVGLTVAAMVAGRNKESSSLAAVSLQTLNRTATPEFPAVAARLVSQTPIGNREAMAREVVRSANSIVQPASIPYVVGAIAQSAPEVAAVAVAEAATLRPELAPRIAQAALDSAPVSRPYVTVVFTPSQTATIERLAQFGVSKADSVALVQLGQSANQVAATPPSAVAPVVPSTPTTVTPATPVTPSVADAQNTQPSQATPTTPTTPTVPTQQGPGAGSPLTVPPTGPFTPITVNDTGKKPGPQQEYSPP